MEQGRKTKLTESDGEDLRAVVTSNREKPKEEDRFKFAFLSFCRDNGTKRDCDGSHQFEKLGLV